jgi:hypothetical protein
MQAVIQVGAISGAIIAISGVGVLLWRTFIAAVEGAIGARIEHLRLQLAEQDEDFAATVTEVHRRLDAIHETVTEVRKQVLPNSGSSLRDRVDALYQLVLTS